MDYSRIWPYVIAVLAVVLVYRRLRRSFGRQLIRPLRMRLRIGLLLVLAAALLPTTSRSGEFLLAEVAGAAAGVALGIWGARRTRYQNHGGQSYYLPHTYTGVAVSLLFVGRLVYRLVELYSMSGPNGLENSFGTQGFAGSSVVKSPFTVGLLFLVVGYYVCYYSAVLWKLKRIGPEDFEAEGASTAAAPK